MGPYYNFQDFYNHAEPISHHAWQQLANEHTGGTPVDETAADGRTKLEKASQQLSLFGVTRVKPHSRQGRPVMGHERKMALRDVVKTGGKSRKPSTRRGTDDDTDPVAPYSQTNEDVIEALEYAGLLAADGKLKRGTTRKEYEAALLAFADVIGSGKRHTYAPSVPYVKPTGTEVDQTHMRHTPIAERQATAAEYHLKVIAEAEAAGTVDKTIAGLRETRDKLDPRFKHPAMARYVEGLEYARDMAARQDWSGYRSGELQAWESERSLRQAGIEVPSAVDTLGDVWDVHERQAQAANDRDTVVFERYDRRTDTNKKMVFRRGDTAYLFMGRDKPYMKGTIAGISHAREKVGIRGDDWLDPKGEPLWVHRGQLYTPAEVDAEREEAIMAVHRWEQGARGGFPNVALGKKLLKDTGRWPWLADQIQSILSGEVYQPAGTSIENTMENDGLTFDEVREKLGRGGLTFEGDGITVSDTLVSDRPAYHGGTWREVDGARLSVDDRDKLAVWMAVHSMTGAEERIAKMRSTGMGDTELDTELARMIGNGASAGTPVDLASGGKGHVDLWVSYGPSKIVHGEGADERAIKKGRIRQIARGLLRIPRPGQLPLVKADRLVVSKQSVTVEKARRMGVDRVRGNLRGSARVGRRGVTIEE
jgi:hypothetical protein